MGIQICSYLNINVKHSALKSYYDTNFHLHKHIEMTYVHIQVQHKIAVAHVTKKGRRPYSCPMQYHNVMGRSQGSVSFLCFVKDYLHSARETLSNKVIMQTMLYSFYNIRFSCKVGIMFNIIRAFRMQIDIHKCCHQFPLYVLAITFTKQFSFS